MNRIRVQKLVERVKNFGLRCILCFEQLTKDERAQGRAYCTACWEHEMEFDDEGKPKSPPRV